MASPSIPPRALEQARARLDEALAASPDDPKLLVLRGRADERVGLYAEAVGFYLRASREHRRLGDRAGEASTLQEAAQAYARGGSNAQARTLFGRAVASWELVGDDLAATRVRLAWARFLIDLQSGAEARQLLERCLEPLTRHASWEDLGWVHEQLAALARAAGELGRALDDARAAVECAAKGKDRIRFGQRLALVAGLHRDSGNWAKAQSYLKKALPHLEAGDDPGPLVDALTTLADAAAALGDADGVRRWLDQAVVAADRGADVGLRGRLRAALGEEVAALEPHRARALLEEATALLHDAGDPHTSGPVWFALAEVLATLREPRAQVAALDRAEAMFRMVGDEAGAEAAIAARRAASAGS